MAVSARLSSKRVAPPFQRNWWFLNCFTRTGEVHGFLDTTNRALGESFLSLLTW